MGWTTVKLAPSILAADIAEVDGGIDATTAPLVIEAGADVLVAGTWLLVKAKA